MGGFLGRIESRGEGLEMRKNLASWRNRGQLGMAGEQRENTEGSQTWRGFGLSYKVNWKPLEDLNNGVTTLIFV